MVNQVSNAEQQRKATERYYNREAVRNIAKRDMQPTKKRASFIEASDGVALERLIGNSDLVGINYLELGLLASRPVCRIQVISTYGRTQGYGTGFLVGPNLLLTNNHVLSGPELAIKSFAEFDFEEDVTSHRKSSKTFDLLPSELFITNPDLDFTLVSVAPKSSDGSSLSSYGMLRLVKRQARFCAENMSRSYNIRRADSSSAACARTRLSTSSMTGCTT